MEGKNYKEGDQIVDESNGFTYPHAANEMKYTATYDSARGDGSNGAFGNMTLMKQVFQWHLQLQQFQIKSTCKDPLKADGLPEAAMDVICLVQKQLVKQLSCLQKSITVRSAEGNTVVVADQKKLGTWKSYLVTNM